MSAVRVVSFSFAQQNKIGGFVMDIQLLREFVELTKQQSITDTASSLNMSQPTLSKHIKQLEQTLHLQLFNRTPEGLRINREGLELLECIYNVIEAENMLLSKAALLKKHPLPHLTVAGLTNEETIAELLSKAVSYLSPKYGTNFLEAKSSHHRTPLELVQKGVVDLAFDYTDRFDYQDIPDVEAVLLKKIRWYALVNVNHPLAMRDSIEVKDPHHQILLRMEGTHLADAWNKIDNLTKARGITPYYRRQYSMKLVDLIAISANLRSEVLLIGENFLRRVKPESSSFVKAIPITDEDAYLPISALFSMNNQNPVLDDLLDFFTNKEADA